MTKHKSFLDIVKGRRTVRHFSDKPINQSDLKKILEAARWAPSSHNTQNWSFIVVKKQSTIEELLKLCYYGSFHTNPKVLIAIVLEPIYVHQKLLLQGNMKRFAETHKYMNISMPALNMLHEAYDLGIGACIMSAIEPQVDRILNVKNPKTVLLMVGLGYEIVCKHHKRARKELKDIVYLERYGAKMR